VAQPQSAARKQDKSTGEVVSDLWGLLKDYGAQETIDPVKRLGRFIAFGSGATFCWGLAGTMFALAVMRIIQVEGRRWFHGNWSLIAYVVALVITVLGFYLAQKQIKKGKTS